MGQTPANIGFEGLSNDLVATDESREVLCRSAVNSAVLFRLGDGLTGAFTGCALRGARS
jgi:hypothetical protein